jgi:hypothetical protein
MDILYRDNTISVFGGADEKEANLSRTELTEKLR